MDQTIITETKSTLELLLNNSSDTQALACFLLCIVLIIAIVLIVRYCAKAIHYISEKNAASMNKLGDKISENNKTNQQILLSIKDTKFELAEKINETKIILKEEKDD